MRLTVGWLTLWWCAVASADLPGDVQILGKCLREISTPDRIDSDVQKLSTYASWASEQVPCLVRCLASEKGWFDIASNRWHKKRLAEELGSDIYNYCRHELRRKSRDGCSFAFNGFRCLKQAELYASKGIAATLQCSRQLNATNMQLMQYGVLGPKESIPCLFQCVANALDFYDEAGNWRLLRWQQAFGPIDLDELPDYSKCRSSDEQRQQAANSCAWMYDEYCCWERLNSNNNGTLVT